jgi:hypothetical protein
LNGNQYTSGNLGLGITSPSTRLHLQGTITFNTGANTSLQIIPAATIGGTDANRIATLNTTPLSFETGAEERMRILATGNVGIGTTTASEKLHVVGNGLFTGSIKTGAPSGGTAQPWKLGTVATVSPTSPNRTIEVEVNGTIYYLHAKTTND